MCQPSRVLVSLFACLTLSCSNQPGPASRTANPGPLLEALVQAWDSHDFAAVDTPQGPVKNRRFSIRGVSVVGTDQGRIIRFTDYYTLAEFYRQVTEKPAK